MNTFNGEKIKYFIYARKSQENEERQVQSIPDQLEDLKKLSTKLNIEIKAVFTEAKSAKAPYTRPVFQEMHSYVTMSFCDILAEARKYGLGLFLTHQYLEQIDSRILAAILGNVGTLISFRIGANDAQALEREFHPTFSAEDLVHLPRYHMYLKLMIDGATSRPFSAFSLPIRQARTNTHERVVRLSRTMYAGSKKDVDANYTTIPSPIPGQLF